MVSFEIYQRFKGHFLNELRVSFKYNAPFLQASITASVAILQRLK